MCVVRAKVFYLWVLLVYRHIDDSVKEARVLMYLSYFDRKAMILKRIRHWISHKIERENKNHHEHKHRIQQSWRNGQQKKKKDDLLWKLQENEIILRTYFNFKFNGKSPAEITVSRNKPWTMKGRVWQYFRTPLVLMIHAVPSVCVSEAEK